MVKNPLTRKGAKLLKYEGTVIDAEKNPIHDVGIFLIGSNSQDSSQAGEIQFIPYVDKERRTFQILLAKEGYQPKIESVNVQKDAKEEQWYSLNEEPYVLSRDVVTPITVNLLPASITSPIVKSDVTFYSKQDDFICLLTLNAQDATNYYASKIFQDIPPAGAKIAIQASTTKPDVAGWTESKIPDGVPPFYLSPASIENSLVVEPKPSVGPKTVHTPKKEISFWIKVLVPVIVFIGVLALAYITFVSRKKISESKDAKRESESKRLRKLGIPWNEDLMKKAEGFMKRLKDESKESFHQAIELAVNLKEQGKQLGMQIERISKAIGILKKQWTKAVSNMQQFIGDNNFIEAQFVANTIRKIEILQQEKQDELNELKNALSKNNLSLKSMNHTISSLMERTQATLTRQEIEDAVKNTQQQHAQNFQMIPDSLRTELLSEDADYQTLLEEARKELSEEMAGEAKIEQLNQFLEARKKIKRR